MAFKWLAEDRYTILLGEKKPAEADYEHLARMLAGLTKIKPILEQKFPEGSPFPSALYSTVQRWEKSCKPKPKEEPPPPSATSSTGTAAASAAAAPGSALAATGGAGGTATAEPMDTPRQAQAAIRKAALFLVEKESARTMGYRILRAVRWDLLDKAPPCEDGKTRLTGPNPQQRTYFQKLLADKEWKNALEKAEAAFTSGANHLWLDLQRIIATACRELGAEFTQVRNAVLVETAFLLKRVPDLTGLSFSDGSPFCDDATKDWIGSEVQQALASSDETGGAAGGGSDALAEEQRAVNQMVAAGQIEQALSTVQANVRSSSNERDNFRRTIIIGTLLLKAKQPDIATSVLESLDKKIDRYSLDKWDPDIAVEAWAALTAAYKVGKAQKPQNLLAVIQEKQNTILSKISQIDPGRAFALSK